MRRCRSLIDYPTKLSQKLAFCMIFPKTTRVDFDQYAEQVKKLLDRHLAGVKVHESEGLYAAGASERSW